MNFYCIVFTGVPLSEPARNELLRAAVRMTKAQKQKYRIVHDDIVGVVTTEWDCGFTGPICGYVFEAVIDTPAGNTEVKYIVPSRHLEEEMIEKVHWIN